MDVEISLMIHLQQQLFADPRRIALLAEIERLGSISQAAKAVGVSYKTAWDNIDAMNNLSPKPLFERSSGGKAGGGTTLTRYAKNLLHLYELLKQLQKNAFLQLYNEAADEAEMHDNLFRASVKTTLQSSARNQFYGQICGLELVENYAWATVKLADCEHKLQVQLTQKSLSRLQLALEKEVMLFIKAPWITLNADASAANCLTGDVVACEQGEVIIHVAGLEVCAATTAQFAIGESIRFAIDPKQIILACLAA